MNKLFLILLLVLLTSCKCFYYKNLTLEQQDLIRETLSEQIAHFSASTLRFRATSSRASDVFDSDISPEVVVKYHEKIVDDVETPYLQVIVSNQYLKENSNTYVPDIRVFHLYLSEILAGKECNAIEVCFSTLEKHADNDILSLCFKNGMESVIRSHDNSQLGLSHETNSKKLYNAIFTTMDKVSKEFCVQSKKK